MSRPHIAPIIRVYDVLNLRTGGQRGILSSLNSIIVGKLCPLSSSFYMRPIIISQPHPISVALYKGIPPSLNQTPFLQMRFSSLITVRDARFSWFELGTLGISRFLVFALHLGGWVQLLGSATFVPFLFLKNSH